jgi:hypothetical protein
MNLGLLLLVLLCIAVAAYATYRVSSLQQELAVVRSAAESAVTQEELDDTVLPLLDRLQAEHLELRRSVAVLASAAQTSGAAIDETRETDGVVDADVDDYDDDDDEGEDVDALEAEAPGQRMQSLLSSVATVVLGSLVPANGTSAAQHRATRVAVRPPPVIEEVDDEELDPAQQDPADE